MYLGQIIQHPSSSVQEDANNNTLQLIELKQQTCDIYGSGDWTVHGHGAS